jgi:outer membrane protein assembly factor BamB
MSRVLAAAVALAAASALAAADWPAWRGPTGQGHADEKAVPLKWSATENVKWKVPLAQPGNSTPVVWKDTIFVTLATEGGTVRSLLCLTRADGKVRWQRDVAYAEPERNWDKKWYANASPATDGERVVVSFGSAGVYCYDLAGKELWKRTDLGAWDHMFGNSASPVIHGDLVIQWCGPNEKQGRNYLLAMDKTTGKTRWESDQPTGSWATPVVAKVDGKDQLVIGMSTDVKNEPEAKHGFLKGFDPATGSELWRCRGLNSYVYASALVGDGVAVGMSGYSGAAFAVKLGGTGDITAEKLWTHPKSTQRVGSGVIAGGHVYMVDENGMPHCYVLKTGEDLWKDEAKLKGGVTWGSMVHAAGRLYVLMRTGETAVLAANPRFELLATNPLGAGEQTNSSPVVAGGEIYLRTFRHLWCVAEKK